MITIDDKLDLFRKLVLDKVRKEYDEKVAEVEQENEEEVKAFQREMEERSNEFVRYMTEKATQERRRLLSRARSDAKHAVLAKRQELIAHLIEAVTDRIHNFVESELYGEFLKDSVKETLEEIKGFSGIELELTREDYHRYGDMLEEALHGCGYTTRQIHLIPVDKDIIGGFVAYDKDRTVRIDCSLAGLIRDNQTFMGRLVFEILSEAGDLHA